MPFHHFLIKSVNFMYYTARLVPAGNGAGISPANKLRRNPLMNPPRIVPVPGRRSILLALLSSLVLAASLSGAGTAAAHQRNHYPVSHQPSFGWFHHSPPTRSWRSPGST
jgi:hypothetical protein